MKKKNYLCVLLCLFVTACQEKRDEHYYASHPQALQEALNACPQHTPSSVLSCDTLKNIRSRMISLTYDLQDDRLAYGRKILALQEQAGSYQMELEAHPNQNTLASLQKIQKQIDEYLLPVMWLESPRNRI